MNDSGKLLREGMWAVAPMSLVLAYLASAELQYFNPMALTSAGIWIGVALSLLMLAGLINSRPVMICLSGVAIVSGIWATLVLTLDLSQVEVSIKANRARCLAIQRDMLSSVPLRSDGPDLFQALGCRPQGEGSVHAPRSTRPFSLAEAKGQ